MAKEEVVFCSPHDVTMEDLFGFLLGPGSLGLGSFQSETECGLESRGTRTRE
jgi:hypothetical protein